MSKVLYLQKLLNKSTFKESGESLKIETVFRENQSQNIWDKP